MNRKIQIIPDESLASDLRIIADIIDMEKNHKFKKIINIILISLFNIGIFSYWILGHISYEAYIINAMLLLIWIGLVYVEDQIKLDNLYAVFA